MEPYKDRTENKGFRLSNFGFSPKLSLTFILEGIQRNTVGARIPNEFGIRMVHSRSVLVPTIQKPNHGKLRLFYVYNIFTVYSKTT